MPYIRKEDRPYLETSVLDLTDLIEKQGNGEVKNSFVTYVIYLLITELYANGDWEKQSDALKVLEDAKLEYYRRVSAPHADKKIEENGDV
jgi:hypothetical protein